MTISGVRQSRPTGKVSDLDLLCVTARVYVPILFSLNGLSVTELVTGT